MEAVALHLCRSNEVEEKWAQLLANMAIKAVTETKMDTLYHNLIMDMTQYVKIKRVATTEENISRAFRGYLTRKNVANKHMKTDLRSPRVLIVTPSIELSAFEPEAIKF
jgi:hypothetical protein